MNKFTYCYNIFALEKPTHDGSKQKENFGCDSRPRDDNKIQALEAFCKEVRIILHVDKETEFNAAVTFIKPPSDQFPRPVVFPNPGIIVGLQILKQL